MLYNLDSHADIQRAHPAYKGSSYQSQPGSLDQLTPADAVYDGSFYWPKDGSAHPSVSASHSATGSANLPCKPQAGLRDARVYPRQNHKKSHSTKEKRGGLRPATYAVLEPVSPMSSTPYGGARHATHSVARRGQSLNERGSDKENRFFSPQSPRTGGGAIGMLPKDHHAEVESWHQPPPPVVASSSFSPGAFSGSIDASPTSTHFPQLPGVSIYLAQHGQVVPVHLHDLETSPDEIIALLGTKSCHPLECAKWMMVATHYRVKGNTLAALAVVTSMIEVMLGVGMEVSQLKPAALMLSSCHLDIAKQLRAEAGRDTTESKYHFNKGCEGLRDIYGAFDQPPSTSSEPIPFCSSFSSVLRHGDNGRSSQQRSPQEATPDSHSCSPEATLPCSQLKILEGEVQSLRNRQEDQGEALNRARTAKRKLEEDLEGERHVRRKLERRLDQAESEASGSQKGEKFALAQCRAEVETRRRAEERADDMRQEAEEVRTSLEPRIAQYGEWERNLKDFFGKLGIVCLKAARGEFGEVLSGRL
ncbi:hypothetical protein VTO73DRAFT_6105 [Trametes versicolor]